MPLCGWLSSTLNTSVAQRLIRLLCPHCKKEEPFEPASYPPAFKPFRPVATHFVAKGCQECYNTGYRGRRAVYEVIPIDQQLTEAIKAADHNVGDLLKERHIKTLAENSFELFQDGLTSLEEIYSLLVN